MRGQDDRGASVTPFKIHVPDAVLDDLQARLANARWTDQIPGTGWDLGTDRDELRSLCEHWRNGYDWRAQEVSLNRLPQFTSEVDGQLVHFVHLRSSRADAVPLLALHGWPGSFVEFRHVASMLAEPEDEALPAFHVVVPSLPGFAFSGPTAERGWDLRRMGLAMAALMCTLGYDRFVLQGGDAGAIAGTQIGLLRPELLLGLHLNLIVVGPPDPADPLAGLSPGDIELVKASQAWAQTESGYSWIQGTRPQTLAYGLHDSPIGLAAWILEKFRRWSDCDGDVWRRFTRDDLLTNIMIYWVTGTIGSSTRLYFETRQARLVADFHGPVNCPTAVAVFPAEHNRFPRPWAEVCYDIRRWTVMPRGGHFAAMEEPEFLVEDVRQFVAELVE